MSLDPERKQAILEHLRELKTRVIYAFLAFIFACLVSYFFSDKIYSFLLKPLAEAGGGAERRIIYTGLAEAFLTYLKLAIFSGLILAFPVIIYQIYAFVAPGLYKYEKPYFIGFLLASPILFLLGFLLVYYFLLPVAWQFFLSFENDNIANLPVQLEARISEYLSLVTNLILAFGLAFQLPVIILILIKLDILTPQMLVNSRKYTIVILLFVAAILTPPDVISQLALFFPLYLLFEISIIIGKRITLAK
ncbi:MAG: twin-arginine translocase subunit TatC [Rickettsiales bacterium]|nr:twin-arginine translocase subunit TatC [Rickettsiales bacterium]